MDLALANVLDGLSSRPPRSPKRSRSRGTSPPLRLFLVAVGPLVGVALLALFRFTRFGKIVRAAASDREMAAGVGIRVPRLFTGVFMFGTALAPRRGRMDA